MLTRDEAGEVIYSVINSGIIDKDLVSDLEDVANGILCEKDGLHIWGAEDQDIADLYTAVRSDLITPEYQNHIDTLYDTYRFYASKFEKKEIEPEEDEEPEEEGEKK